MTRRGYSLLALMGVCILLSGCGRQNDEGLFGETAYSAGDADTVYAGLEGKLRQIWRILTAVSRSFIITGPKNTLWHTPS